ncbi:protein phosphatase 2C domain-containing protein [Massilia sp. CCM 8734]|uniref:PP2C family protein-serine/threonine phosphatase n=1 Tax=Massilia sp. CCM 8734 TaxID=2609283 RepID=UPI00141F6D00|nr:protein phosphatase 2C domain-containing protein [Massilia sp. CCM 8734]
MPAATMVERNPIRLAWTRISEIGMRASNQDAVGEAQHGDISCFIIADGAGGHEGGEVAAHIVVEAMLEKFAAAPAFGAHALLSYTANAIASVAKNKQTQPQNHDMSATVAALLVDQANAHALWAHLGDTRVYLFRDAQLVSVTRDHSLTQQLIDAGYARAEQLRSHPQRNILFAAVGAEGETPVALGDGPVQLLDGDALLVCSDGLWEWVHEDEMERTLAESGNSEQWLSAMCALAEAALEGTDKVRDNFSAYAIRVESEIV